MNQRLDSLQILRAFAALSVVFNHFWGVMNYPIFKLLGLDYIGGFGVDIFFVLSGFIMCYTVKDDAKGGSSEALNFFLKRVNRIYPSYLVILVPFLIFAIFIKKDWSIYQVVGNILLLPTFFNNPDYYMYVTPSWTLVYEMFFYFIFSFAILFSNNKMRIVIVTSTFIVAMVFLVNVFDLRGERLRWTNFSFMIGDTLMLNFIAGCIFALFYKKLYCLNINNAFLFLTSMTLFFVGMILARYDISRFISFGIPAIIIVSFISLYRCRKSKVNYFLIFIGNASYSIYLIHYLFAAVLFRVGGGEGKTSILISTLFMFSSVAAGSLFHLYVERRITRLPIFSIK
ncbi:acyltransferase [Gibbsiella dentisursi]|uniref:Acyltransferase n=1 Tax=Gibbsiella dentisursi TaxID=796890 RepID=A0ABP7KQD0_9GAMM